MSNVISRVTIGTDPEFFLEEKETRKKISAIPYIPGTKHAPLFLSNGSKMQHDNVTLEFATMPARDAVDLANKIRETLTIIRPHVPANMNVIAEASAEFDEEQLNNYEALAFGCEPDYNAWTMSINNPPSIDTMLRSCGGHLHIGHTEGDSCNFLLDHEGKIHTVRMLDAIHGVGSVILDSSRASLERRKLYGKAGCYRPTSYGLEYRVLSNFWLKSPKTVLLVDLMLQDALAILKNENVAALKNIRKNLHLIRDIGGSTIQKTINKSDKEVAEGVFQKYVAPVLQKETLELFEEVKMSTFKSIYEEWA